MSERERESDVLLLLNEKQQNITICEQTNITASSKCYIAKVTKVNSSLFKNLFVLVFMGKL